MGDGADIAFIIIYVDREKIAVMTRKLIVCSLVAVLMVGVGTPSFAARAHAAAVPVASATHTQPAIFDKTRFLLHAGAAFFIIHHEYGRYKQGYFAAGSSGRLRHLAVAAVALVLAIHEAKVAYGIAKTSNSKTLQLLASPFAALSTTMDSIRGKFAQGQGSASDFQSLNNATTSINSTASSNGLGAIKDVTAPLPAGA